MWCFVFPEIASSWHTGKLNLFVKAFTFSQMKNYTLLFSGLFSLICVCFPFSLALAQPQVIQINDSQPSLLIDQWVNEILSGSEKDYSPLIDSLASTLVQQEDSFELFYKLGRGYIIAEKIHQGKPLLLQAVKIGEAGKIEMMKAYYALAYASEWEGNYRNAVQFFEKVAEQYEKMPEKDEVAHQLCAYALEHCGNGYSRLGDFNKAYLHLKKALGIAEKYELTQVKGTCLTDLGITAELLGNTREAIAYFERALSLFEKEGLIDQNYAVTHLDISSVLVKTGEKLAAEKHLQTAIQVLKELEKAAMAAGDELLARSHQGYLGQAYDALGLLLRSDRGNAISAFETAIAYGEKAYQQRRSRELSRMYVHLAEAFYDWGKWDLALRQCQQALLGVLPDMKLAAVPVLPDPETFYPEFVLLEALSIQAKCFMGLYEKTRSQVDLSMALESFRLANTAAHLLRYELGHSNDKLLLTDETHQRAEHALAAAYALYQSDPQEKHWQLAFEFAERSKANLLMEAFQDREARFQVGLPDSLLDREAALQKQLIDAELVFRELKLSDSPQRAELKQAEDDLYHARRAYDLLEERLEKDFPNYYQLKYETQTPGIVELRSTLLKNGEAIIEFFKGDEYLYIFMLTQHEHYFFRKANSDTISELVSQMLTSLTSMKEADRNAFSDYAYRLFHETLETLPLQGCKRLILIPDRELALIPFEALLSSKALSGPQADLPFLIKDHIVSYAYSAHLLYNTYTRERPSGMAKRSFLGMAPGIFPGTQLAALPHTTKEVTDLQRKLGGLALTGPEAQKEALLNLSNEFQILHLSTHAVSWDRESKTAWIALSDGQDKTAKVRLAELASLRLNADITVLSACETGTGQIERGEGVMSLARAFTFAGSQATLQSLWPVRPVAAEPLIQAFYKGLRAGKDKATALHEAKLQLLSSESPALQAPIMWAAFAAIGDMRPVEIKPAVGFGAWGWGALISGMVFLLGFFLWKRKV